MSTYLIDNDGELIHSWESDGNPGLSAYLLPDGRLLRTQSVTNQVINAGGGGGKVLIMDWDGNKQWEYTLSSDKYRLHHDVEYLPNGNILMIAWANKSESEAIDAGRNPELIFNGAVWYTRIIEVKPEGSSSGEIVWEWNAWDHLIQDYDSNKLNYGAVNEHRELIDLNYVENPNGPNTGADWLHTNGIDYNEELDQILLSVHNFSEIWIIDHGTTTEEAAGNNGGAYGRGGDLLYRWGNPETYDMGTASDRKLYNQHDAEWIPAGYPGENNITIFNNGDRRLRAYSSVEEIATPINESGNYTFEQDSAFGPDEIYWSYSAEQAEDFYAENISGAQRLANGNTLICSGPSGEFFEVTADKQIVWKYINPVTDTGPVNQGDEISSGMMGQANACFRAERYQFDYPAFDGKDLTPKGTIELDVTGTDDFESAPDNYMLNQNYPNPFNPETIINYSISNSGPVIMTVFNSLGQKVKTLVNEFRSPGKYSVVFNAENLSSGVYYCRIKTADYQDSIKMILQK